MVPDPPPTRLEAMRRWKTACMHLSNAIQAFSKASSTFVHDMTDPTVAYASDSDLEIKAVVHDFDTELQRLVEDDETIHITRRKLNLIRNTSSYIVPIHKLPLDVLSRISAIVVGWGNDDCDNYLSPDELPMGTGIDWKAYAVSLSSVCSKWRRIVIDTPSLWSHIDARITPEGWDPTPTEYAKLCFQGVKDAPLDLHACSHNDNKPFAAVSEDAPLPEYLRGQPITSLNLALEHPQLMEPALLAWQNHAPTHNITSIKLRTPEEERSEPISVSRAILSQHLQSLYLKGAYVDWGQVVLPRLVDLELDNQNSRFCPSIEQLQDMLAASPELRTLQIRGIAPYQESTITRAGLPTIKLRTLTFLNLGYMPSDVIALFLRLIEVASECTALTINFPNEYHPPTIESPETLWEAIGNFCIQHKVRCLSLHMFAPADDMLYYFMARLLSSLNHLHTLTLWYLDLLAWNSVDPLSAKQALAIPSTLQCLYLRESEIPIPALRRIVYPSSIQRLRLDNCVLHQEEATSNFDDRERIEGFPEDLVKWLKGLVPNLHIESDDNVILSTGSCELSWWLTM